MTRIGRILVICVFTCAMSTAVSAATFVVNTTNDTVDAAPGDGNCADAGAMCSLRAAISEANALAGADDITLPAGTYTQSLVAANDDANVGGDWDVTSQITINGAGEATTILQANATIGVATERVINVRAGGNLTLNGMTVRHGRFTGTMTTATRGAGIENLAILTLNNVTVRDNQISSTAGNPIAAGVQNAGTNLTITNSTITANTCTRVSGGSAFGGGIASITASTILITGTSISGNNSTSQAGGFGFGAGLYLENLFNVTINDSSLNNNTGSGSSGTNGVGVRALSNIGAAVFNATNTTFNGNSGGGGPSAQGSGIQFFTTAAAATLNSTLDRVTVNGNSGNFLGVGIAATPSAGTLTVNLRNSTISNNTGGVNGGGLGVSNSTSGNATFNVLNSTVSGNISNGNGGGIALDQPGTGITTINLNFVTVANNRANNDNSGTEAGGGISRTNGVMNIKNSLIADNTLGSTGTAPDISGTVNSQDYNHIEDPTGATIGGTTANNATGDPQLGALGANGGPTNTHLPGSASPVLNTIPNGTNDCGSAVTLDQRGSIRPSGAGCDKGSVERAAVAAGPWDLSGFILTADGRGIRNVIVTLSGGGLPQPIHIQTGHFGSYGFVDIPGGTYTLSVSSKRFTFAAPSRPITLSADVINENFAAQAGPILRQPGLDKVPEP